MMLTSCTMMCPLMAERMAYLQKLLPSHAASIRLLSITVDPEKDTPTVLFSYGKRFHRDPDSWTFVTGETQPIFESVNAGYNRAGMKGSFDHGDTLVLVDGDGRIRGYYRKDDSGVARMFADADRLALASSESASR
jgi:protein SCO1/2